LSAEFFGGPLPHPEHLAKYNEAFPGCAERIVVMAEQQARHRRDLESTVIKGNAKRQDRAQLLGFTAFVGIAGGSFYLLTLGMSATGISLLLGDLLAFGFAFIYGQRKQDEELAGKRKQFEPEDPTKKIPAGNKD